MRSAVSLAGAGALWALSGQALAACNDTKTCELRLLAAPAMPRCRLIRAPTAYSRDDGSVLIFDQNVTLTTTTANVHLLTVRATTEEARGLQRSCMRRAI